MMPCSVIRGNCYVAIGSQWPASILRGFLLRRSCCKSEQWNCEQNNSSFRFTLRHGQPTYSSPVRFQGPEANPQTQIRNRCTASTVSGANLGENCLRTLSELFVNLNICLDSGSSSWHGTFQPYLFLSISPFSLFSSLSAFFCLSLWLSLPFVSLSLSLFLCLSLPFCVYLALFSVYVSSVCHSVHTFFPVGRRSIWRSREFMLKFGGGGEGSSTEKSTSESSTPKCSCWILRTNMQMDCVAVHPVDSGG